ncbi:MAG: hypothetical protein JSV49_07645 [Thermoplasmata archaeon]|nr:MAG: hypothetical protein JSV49_07645 [Thermoplasmata archaeon]
MLDWVNTKAALSICTLALVAAAGMWYEYNADKLQDQEFQAMLDNFVAVVDEVGYSSAYISLNITHSEQNDGSGGYYLNPLFNDKTYQIILTETHAVFSQDQLRCSRAFATNVALISSPHQIESSQYIQPGTIFTEKDLSASTSSILKLESVNDLTVTKIRVESSGIEQNAVMIVQQ